MRYVMTLFAAATVCVLFSPATSAQTFLPPVAYPTGALAPNGVALGDLNGDGRLDVVVANTDSPGTIAVLLGNGDGTLQPAVTYAAGSWPQFVVLADFNKDGHLDVAVANRAIGGSGWVNIFLGNGDGTLRSPVSYGPFFDAFSLAVADFNHDGTLDIAVADVSSGSLLLGKGDGTFHLGNPIGASAPVFFAVADFNRDHNLDLASAFNTGSTIQILSGNGRGAFSLTSSFVVATPPIALVARDFNGDGIPDIAAADEAVNNLGSNVTVLESSAAGYVAKKYPFGDEPRLIVAADFNRDGRIDLATENEFNGTVDVFLNSKGGVFRSPLVLADGAPTAASLAVGDLNGDRKIDIVVTDGLNNVRVLLQK
jgi:hypothetical protein